MMWRLGYAVLTLGLIALIVRGLQIFSEPVHTLPLIPPPAGVVGLSCEEGLAQGRALAKPAPESARLVYLYLSNQCGKANSPVVPELLLEAGSLCAHLLQKPREAQTIYEEFLRRFPEHPDADDATYYLAKLEIDAGNYADAVVHLTALVQRYPNSSHYESATFLASRAAELVLAERSGFRTLAGQFRSIVPNNPLSLIAVLLAIGPAALELLSKAKRERQWVIPALILLLTALNYAINNFESIQKNTRLMETFTRLAMESSPESQAR